MASLKGSFHEINQAAATDPECCCQGPLETEPHYSGLEILASGKSKDRFQNLNPGPKHSMVLDQNISWICPYHIIQTRMVRSSGMGLLCVLRIRTKNREAALCCYPINGSPNLLN